MPAQATVVGIPTMDVSMTIKERKKDKKKEKKGERIMKSAIRY